MNCLFDASFCFLSEFIIYCLHFLALSHWSNEYSLITFRVGAENTSTNKTDNHSSPYQNSALSFSVRTRLGPTDQSLSDTFFIKHLSSQSFLSCCSLAWWLSGPAVLLSWGCLFPYPRKTLSLFPCWLSYFLDSCLPLCWFIPSSRWSLSSSSFLRERI